MLWIFELVIDITLITSNVTLLCPRVDRILNTEFEFDPGDADANRGLDVTICAPSLERDSVSICAWASGRRRVLIVNCEFNSGLKFMILCPVLY